MTLHRRTIGAVAAVLVGLVTIQPGRGQAGHANPATIEPFKVHREIIACKSRAERNTRLPAFTRKLQIPRGILDRHGRVLAQLNEGSLVVTGRLLSFCGALFKAGYSHDSMSS